MDSENVNLVLQRLSEEPVCEETKRELLIAYLRENALAALRSLPNDAFLSSGGVMEEEELELLGSIRGLSEKESALYAQKPCKRKNMENNNSRQKERVSLKMNGTKRMADLPNFLPPKNGPISKLPVIIVDDNNLKEIHSKHMEKLELREVLRDTGKVYEVKEGSLLGMLSQISADSCQNELSSASSEFFPTPPTSGRIFY